MKYASSIISDIKEKINKFLNNKKWQILTPLDEIFADPTRRTCFSIITDAKGIKYFLKIRTLDMDFDKKAFEKQLNLGNVLNSHPEILLNKYTPKLIDGGLGEIDYLLYEYIEGENLGSRTDYGILKLNQHHIKELFDIMISLWNFPVNLLSSNYEKRGGDYYKYLLTFASGEQELKKYLEIDWSLLDKETKFYSQGDFKPNNFIKTAQGLMIVDFEQASISNPLADIVSFLAYIINNPKFRQDLIDNLLLLLKQHFGNDAKYKKLFDDLMLIHVVFEYNALKNVIDGHSKKYQVNNNLLKFLHLREEDMKKMT